MYRDFDDLGKCILAFSLLVSPVLAQGEAADINEPGFEGIAQGIDFDIPMTTEWLGTRSRDPKTAFAINGDDMPPFEYVVEALSFAPEGTQVLKISGAARYVSQNLGIRFQANHRYRLTVSVGNIATPVVAGTETTAGNTSILALTGSRPNRALNRVLPDAIATLEIPTASEIFPADTFEDFTLQFTTGDEIVNQDIYILLAANGGGHSYFDNVRLEVLDLNAQDEDLDGLPNSWEIDNGLNPNDDGTTGESSPGAKDGPDGPLGDPDNDSLINEDEFLLGTNPKNDDTDGDDIPDFVELGMDSFFDDLDTDPRLADTDGDRIDDGVEDANQNGMVDDGETDPRNSDSDVDGLEDGYEVMVTNSDPLDATDPPLMVNAIGISLYNDRQPSDTDSALEETDVAGHPDYRQAQWNNFFADFTNSADQDTRNQDSIDTPSAMMVVDSQGMVQPVTINVEDFRLWSTLNRAQSANDRLMKGYWAGDFTIDLAGIPYANYDLVVYCGAVDARNGTVTLSAGDASQIGISNYAGQPALDSFTAFDYVISTDTTGSEFPLSNVVVFEDVTEPAVTINHVSQNSVSGIFAIQIVEQNPTLEGPPSLAVAPITISSGVVELQAGNLLAGSEYHYEILVGEEFEDLAGSGFTADMESVQSQFDLSVLGTSAILRLAEGAEEMP